MTLTSIAPIVTNSGVIAPTYYEAVEFLKDSYKAIYGDDVYLENDSQDGQWIGVLARVVADCGAACIDAYSTFSPKTANDDALSRNVAINGIRRAIPTYSSVDLMIGGIPGTEIKNGYSPDPSGINWMLPELVVIPQSGEAIVTAQASKVGAYLALPNTVTTIGKPTRGWRSVNNTTASTLGMSVESNAKLRQRQALSVAIPSQSKTDSIKGSIFSLPGVSRCKTYENDSDGLNAIGIPAHSLCVVVSGGDTNEIAQIMRAKKSMGCGYFGNTDITTLDAFNESVVTSLYRPDVVNIGFRLNLISTTNYTIEIGEEIKQAIADYVNQLDIGDRITLNKVYVPAGLYGNLDSMSYDVSLLKIIVNGLEIDGDYSLNFNQVAFCDTDNIEINISGGD